MVRPVRESGQVTRRFFEFFAGGGMARAGLGPAWTCAFANDFDHKKSAVYRLNWGDDVLRTADVRNLAAHDLPGSPDLVWASFPCQDLSLAGGGAGLRGDRSGTFWPFWSIMKGLIIEGRAPRIIALENVLGTLTSHGGKDFSAICSSFTDAGYRFGALVADAALFLPHSRPRLFVIGIRNDVDIPIALSSAGPSPVWHSKGLVQAYDRLPERDQNAWLWWSMPTPPARKATFAELIEDHPADIAWHSPDETASLLAMMSPLHLAKVEAVKRLGRKVVGTIYKRTRVDEAGFKVQRAEVRFDEIAGCLRTPAGGSSRQLILVVEKGRIRSRLISGRETARLMGLPEEYRLPGTYNETYHLTGDGVVVPVVRHLAQSLFEPILDKDPESKIRRAAA
mgnify:CR=1 FL=1